MATKSLYLVALAVIGPYLYDRGVTFSGMLANRPGKFENLNLFKEHQVKFAQRMRNCEDVLIEEGMGVAFVSCNPGRDQWNTVMGTFAPPRTKTNNQDDAHIWLYDYSTPNLPDSAALKPLTLVDYPNPTDFHPLGIEFDAQTSTLYVINHSRHSGNTLDLFQISPGNASAQYIKTLTHPLLRTPNSIHSLGAGKLLMTNDHYIGALTSPLLSKIETFSSLPGGSVVYVDTHEPARSKKLAHVAFANGIAMLNSTTVAVASTAKPAVYLYSFDKENVEVKLVKHIRLPFMVDNIAVDSAGKLLMAGHPFALGLMVVSKARARCDEQGGEEERKACECTTSSWAAEWSEEEGVKTLYKNDGSEFCSSSTFARDAKRNVNIVTGLYERGDRKSVV